MEDIKEALAEEFKDKEARRQYAIDFLNSHIALQIKTLRQQRKWSQTGLAKLAGKHQSQISAMESVDFGAWKISTLQKLAEAFDLALTVNFESFGGFLDYISALDRGALERPSFADDPAFHPSAVGPALSGYEATWKIPAEYSKPAPPPEATSRSRGGGRLIQGPWANEAQDVSRPAPSSLGSSRSPKPGPPRRPVDLLDQSERRIQ